MKLVDRYIYDVTRRLPERQRQDVGNELRSEIEAMIEDEAKGKKPTSKHEYAVLSRMGDPAQLSDQYLERQRYIIGPMYYEKYCQMLKTLLYIIVPIIVFFTFTAKLATAPDHAVVSLLAALGAGFEVGLHVAFWVTLCFFLVERSIDAKTMSEDVWTPDQLPSLPPQQQITKTDALVGMTWSIIAVWASAMQIPEIHAMFARESPLFFAPEMWPYWTLALLGMSVLSLGSEIMKYIVGGWTGPMVAVITAVNVLVIAYFTSLVSSVQPIASPAFTEAVSKLLGEADVASGMDITIRVFITSVVLISLYEIYIAVKSYVMTKRRKSI